jgi:ribose/xylose/arabinose/galactoside ABC-type transport system permease subunit
MLAQRTADAVSADPADTEGSRILGRVAGSTLTRLILAYALLVVVFALSADHFLTLDNFLNIGRATSVFGIAALGLTVALITGALDVSFGAVMSLCGIVAAERIGAGDGVGWAIVIALAVGCGLGLVNAVLSSGLRLDPLIVTLGTLSIFGGYAFLRTNGAPTPAPNDAFADIGRGELLGIPTPLILLLGLALLLALVLRFTSFGQRCYLVGDNPRAAALAGIGVSRVRAGALVISGLTAACAGVVMVANAGVANAGEGERNLLSAIAAVVIGGTGLAGGTGLIAGTLIGIAVLGTIDNGLNLLGVSSTWQDVLKGVIVIAALVLDRFRKAAG